MSQQLRNKDLLLATARRLKNLRSERKLSQEIVYNDTGIHIARIETAKTNISVSQLQALCSYYSISLRDFFAEGFELFHTKV
jgi:transcriptional regulator with XRE-family HTH domain